MTNMNIIAALDIGSMYQNIAFYAFLMLLIFLNFNILKYRRKQKELNQATPIDS